MHGSACRLRSTVCICCLKLIWNFLRLSSQKFFGEPVLVIGKCYDNNYIIFMTPTISTGIVRLRYQRYLSSLERPQQNKQFVVFSDFHKTFETNITHFFSSWEYILFHSKRWQQLTLYNVDFISSSQLPIMFCFLKL